ncbi:hypothetical protein OUZ56_017099 [Daphnia magna]|uniref:Uncharacterized protein n=1 Tax=Daphnia magna TaxID=35525 RepID=A0ABR0AS80_9CRUS|nr:hypothetical protein OUZ56_017099 [Daphnia magna]
MPALLTTMFPSLVHCMDRLLNCLIFEFGGGYDVMLLFAFAILMATSVGTDGFVLIWTLDYTTPTPYYTTSYAAPSYSTKVLSNILPHMQLPATTPSLPTTYYTTRTPKYYTTIYSAPTY